MFRKILRRNDEPTEAESPDSEEKFEEWMMDEVFPGYEETLETTNETTPIKNIDTFKNAGVMTDNKGLVIKFNSGKEFQLTIVQSK